jgi:hypothetical protein
VPDPQSSKYSWVFSGENQSCRIAVLTRHWLISSAFTSFFCDLLSALAVLPEKTLTSEELSQLQELLCNGYWAFECLTVRDYNDMICGICGVAPKVEMAQRNEENVLALKSVEVSDSQPWVTFRGVPSVW